MAGRGRTTFQKRQKEQHRRERREQKAVRKDERKDQAVGGLPEIDEGFSLDSDLDSDMNAALEALGLPGVKEKEEEETQ